MLKKEDISKIAKLLKLDEAALNTALTATEETVLTIPELSVFTTDELTARDQNTKTTGYAEGKTAGVEMLVKDLKAKHGVEIDSKDPEKFIEAFKANVLKDAKVEPNQKITELNGVIETLKGNIAKFDTEKSEYEKKLSQVYLEKDLTAKLPKNLAEIIDHSTALNELKANYEFAVEDGKPVVKKGGQIVRDSKTQDALPWEAVITNHLKEKKWLSEEGGTQGRQGRAGGTDSGSGGVPLKLSELSESWTAEGKSIQSAEFTQAVLKAREANPSFDMTA